MTQSNPRSASAHRKRFTKQDYKRFLSGQRLIDDNMMTVFFCGNCKHVQKILRIILDKQDLIVQKVTTQKKLTNLKGRSVILDILASDSSGKRFNIEFQRTKNGAHPKRLRYHQSMIDTAIMPKGKSPRHLPDVYVIMIMEKNYFKIHDPDNKIPVFHIDHTIRETGNSFDDGAHILYVNGEYRSNNTIGLLLHDFFVKSPDEMIDQDMADKFKRLKNGEPQILEKIAMNAAIKKLYNEWKLEGIEIGKSEGEARKLFQMIKRYMEIHDTSLEQTFDLMGITTEEQNTVKEIMKKSVQTT